MNFNLTLYHLALIAGGFTILGALIGNWISHRLTESRDRKKRGLDASDKFRNTIIAELSELYPEGIYHIIGSGAVNILREKHNKISAAVLEYRTHVTNKELFDLAWDEFTGVGTFREKEEKPRYNQYSFTGRNNEFYEEPEKRFVSNLEKLLEFAKHK